MKEFTLSIEELNQLFIACIAQEQRSTGRTLKSYKNLQTKIKDLAKVAMDAPDFEILMGVLNV